MMKLSSLLIVKFKCFLIKFNKVKKVLFKLYSIFDILPVNFQQGPEIMANFIKELKRIYMTQM